MFDLYHLPTDFPGMDGAQPTDPYQRVVALESAFAADIADRRFTPYLQLHEFETILFADPSAFGDYFPESESQQQLLLEVAALFGNIELINGEPQTHPSARLAEIYPDFDKRTAGIFLAEYIGLSRIREKCSHFHNWLTQLEGLAQ
jgi:hypothetical protein